jgi:hypothetical protein
MEEKKNVPKKKKYFLIAGSTASAQRTRCIQRLIKEHGGEEYAMDVDLFNFLGPVCYALKDVVIINDFRETEDISVGLFPRLSRLFVFSEEDGLIGEDPQSTEPAVAVHVSQEGELSLLEENAKLRKELAEALKTNEQLLHTMQSMH